MGLIHNSYTNSTDYNWYESSNVVFSECYDTNTNSKTLKVVFKGGRTYLYQDVDINDYLLFKNSESVGKGLNEFIIKKYKGVRMPDVDINELEKIKEKHIENTILIAESTSKLNYRLDMDDDNNFKLYLNDTVIFSGKENEVSIIKLLKSMQINYIFNKNNNE